MSYNIGQLRRNQITKYDTPMPLYPKDYSSNHQTYITEDIYVYDVAFVLATPLEKDTNYYFSFIAEAQTQELTVTLVGGGREMPIKTFSIKGQESFCELVFTPNDNVYTKIVVKKKRTNFSQYDYAKIKIKGTNGYNDWLIEEDGSLATVKLKKLVNVINSDLKRIYGLQYIKKMGLQGPPGFMFSMNGEEIHIGKSGMYEVEGINISNLSFVIKNISPIPYEDNLDYFIMDFLY